MRYGKEVIDLISAFPGREWCMAELVTYIVGVHADRRARMSVRRQVLRVMEELEQTGTVKVIPQEARGGTALYVWTV